MIIKSFGKIKDIIPQDISISQPFTDVANLRMHLEVVYPTLKGMIYLVAINQQIVSSNDALMLDCEIALLPPFSGG